jgi:hypothetical protein
MLAKVDHLVRLWLALVSKRCGQRPWIIEFGAYMCGWCCWEVSESILLLIAKSLRWALSICVVKLLQWFWVHVSREFFTWCKCASLLLSALLTYVVYFASLCCESSASFWVLTNKPPLVDIYQRNCKQIYKDKKNIRKDKVRRQHTVAAKTKSS